MTVMLSTIKESHAKLQLKMRIQAIIDNNQVIS